MTIEEALKKLYSMHQFGVKLGLENITHLLSYLGNPEKKFKSIHIAGSNGKGSTASFTASILKEAGYKTGLYTSPHLVKFNERVRINGKEIPDEFIAKFMNDHQKYIDKNQPTFFEITTALAFKYFEENEVEFAVIETGLGGRLDATNTIIPEASVITSISAEHTNILGNTLEEIAGEKAGIIKEGIPVFTGILPEEAEKVFTKKTEEKNCNLFNLKQYLQVGNDFVRISLEQDKSYTIYDLPLKGSHQKLNAVLSILALNKVLKIDDYKIINAGLSKVVENSGLQARYEIESSSPKVIFDAAHNPEGINSFVNEFKTEYKNFDERVLIFGVMKDKNIAEMLSVLKPYFTKFNLTTINYERAASIKELKDLSSRLEIETGVVEEPADFINNFIKKRNNKSCLVVLGSIYIIGAIKATLLSKST